jgi:hypothetical protein
MTVADEIDALYDLPLEEFTHARDELARRLRSGGHADDARQVKSLRKPTVSAWALNQLARRHRDEVRALLSTAERMKDASADDLRELSAARKRLVGSLVERADQILKDAGHAAGPTHRERISRVLLGATGDRSGDELLEGRLSRDPELGGFEAFAVPAVPEDEPAIDARRSKSVRRAEELAREAEAAAAEAHRLRRAAEAAERSWRKARQDAETAARRAETLGERARRAADDLAR